MPAEADYRRWSSEHCQWLNAIYKEIRLIKPGASRGELLKVFTEEGGISHSTFQSFICRECSLIRVDVKFDIYAGEDRTHHWMSETGEEHSYDSRDRVSEISAPALGYPNWD